ncbi:MarR family winged helix-turn-helix transcriptional regulator [Rhodococcus opacus]|uniref:MarR family winged helix-turn-helix transcriptional regulator n=1 Tax=Rhodococcus opacus TaxID=37919 RepID=UPI002474E0BB|nr:MarR family transcriptional regulator [Rhodococcus opacus]MDH6286248.1 DNA-binding MarR family transcriptional regulator [Rhodococcus opacus]
MTADLPDEIDETPFDGEYAHDSSPTLLYAIKQVELAIRSHMDALLRPMGITALQYTALTVLRRRDGLSSAELARNSFVTAQTMGEMLSALERRGLVTRRVDPANRRRMLTSLTPEALDLLAEYDTSICGLEEQMLADMSVRQREAFRGYLGRCRTALAETPAH